MPDGSASSETPASWPVADWPRVLRVEGGRLASPIRSGRLPPLELQSRDPDSWSFLQGVALTGQTIPVPVLATADWLARAVLTDHASPGTVATVVDDQ